jgi:hypothetical protein
MLVDVTAYQQERARCGIDTQTGHATRHQTYHGPLLHHSAVGTTALSP